MSSSGRSTHGRGRGSGQSRFRSGVNSSSSTPSAPLRGDGRGNFSPQQLQFPSNVEYFVPDEPSHPVNDDASSHQQNAPNQISLEDLLNTPGRKEFLPNLDPFPADNTSWFDRDDDGSLVRKICGILRGGFNGAWYSWTQTPPDARDAYFVKFAQSYYWDPAITEIVREEFHKVCVNRMKGIVSQIKSKGKCPGWLDGDIWNVMLDHWSTEAAKKKSATASAARNSSRDGLGPHKHVSGQKTYYRVKQDLAKELERPPTLSEIFIKTHTTSTGSFVDYKAKNIVETFEQTVSEKLSQVDSNMSDGTSQADLLTPTDLDDLFLQSTTKDSRGREYGLGSLARNYGSTTKKRIGNSSTSTFQEIEQYKRELHQYKEDTEKKMALLQQKNSAYEMLLGYMKEKDPTFAAYLATNPPCPPPTDVAGPSGGSETQPPDTNDLVHGFSD